MIEHVRLHTIPAAYALLPPAMASDRATAMLLAIALQESRFVHRHQVGGPATGFWQFEVNGVRGVVTHPHTKDVIALVLTRLRYEDLQGNPALIHEVLEHNDVLAACFARCLLWTIPAPLPAQDEPATGWLQYFEAWRPGRPRRESWDPLYAHAWEVAQHLEGG